MASHTLVSAAERIFAMSRTIAPTTATLLSYILPPFMCQYFMAVLVQLERTRTYRLALLPITLCLAWRATFVDMSGSDSTKEGLNVLLINQMCIIATRSAVWAFTRIQYRYRNPIDNRNESAPNSLYTACWNSWDLLLDSRGIRWNWSRGLVVPKRIFETDSRVIFVLLMGVGFIFHAFGLDTCAQMIHVLSPKAFGSPKGGPLFDHTLPPILEFARAIAVSILTAAAAYFALEHSYHFLAILCVTFFRHHPSQWPPLFDGAPFMATSLTQLWGRRWHQLMRNAVLSLGYRPFKYLLGPYGGLFGAFLVSGIFHIFDLGQRGHTIAFLGFYMMNAFGIVLERIWEKTTGKPVGGIWGWMWIATWLLMWGIPMVDAYARAGRLGALSVIGGIKPASTFVVFICKVFGIEAP